MTPKKIKKKNGDTVYKANIYLGIDSLTGKKSKTTITAPTLKKLKILAKQKSNQFEQNNNTLRKTHKIVTFEELANLWKESYRITVKQNTWQLMQGRLEKYILPELGSMQVDKITPHMIQLIVNRWAHNANNVKDKRTIGARKDYSDMLALIKRILHHGFALGIIDNNPASLVKAPKLLKKAPLPIKYWTDEQVKQLFLYMDSIEQDNSMYFDRVLFKFLLATGLRIGEAYALEWSDIDLENNTVHVNKTMVKGKILQDTPKTDSGVREVPIDRPTSSMLVKYHQKQRELFLKSQMRTSVVFADNFGKHRSINTRRYTLGRICEKAGIPVLGFHAFRHTHASILINNGADFKQLQHRLGHASIQMTMDIYGHLSPSKAREVTTIFEKAVSNL
jgi:Site-specific recombinase XerD